AKRCLASNPGDRYSTGEEVAAAITAYRLGVAERLRRAERDRAAAEAKAAEEVNTRREAEARADAERAKASEQPKRRRTQLILAVAVLLLVCGAGAFAWHSDRVTERARLKQAEFEAEQARDETERKAIEAVAAERERFAKEQARQGVAANLKLAADL